MSEKIIYIKEIGEIKLIKNKRAKRLTIRIKPFTGVVVTIPFLFSYKNAETFVDEKKDWILKNLSKIENIEDKKTVFTENTVYNTNNHVIRFNSFSGKRISILKKSNELLIKYPDDLHVRDEKLQNTFRKIIENVLKTEAENYMPFRVSEIAKKFNFKYKNVNIRNTKSRWGSCSSDNDISLSLHLMRLPAYLIDYVILHELCHTIEKNHGKGFWNLLEKVSGDSKGLNKELRNYNARIY
ncbi:MAG: M48 family metallopeptidase [Bacteroidales bacterium]|nr:M48 family metallopeptidase [Bacteroidales bacterium]MBN2756709.1 M48 family metallopeptidase [Bacteroidales bacterium]